MAQTLARHSDINLTMNVYTMMTIRDQAEAVEALPPLPTTATESQPQTLRATGTDGQLNRQRQSKMVPPVVPRRVRSANDGAALSSVQALHATSTCTQGVAQEFSGTSLNPPETLKKTRLFALLHIATHRIESVAEAGLEGTSKSSGKTGDSVKGGAESGAVKGEYDTNALDLQAVIEAWPSLSLADQKAILEIIRWASAKATKT